MAIRSLSKKHLLQVSHVSTRRRDTDGGGWMVDFRAAFFLLRRLGPMLCKAASSWFWLGAFVAEP